MLAGTERQITKEPAPTAFRPSLVWSLHIFMFASGALALIYEILWMRRFAAVFGATTPAVAATLAAIFLGFTCGNLAVGRWAARFVRPLRAYAVLEIGIAVGALIVQPMIALYDSAYPRLYDVLSGSPGGFLVVKTLLATLALFVPACCMGGTVPLLGHALVAHHKRLGVEGGGLYAANIIGAALGALSVPFFWLPTLGATTSYLACVAGNFIIGGLAWWLDPGPGLTNTAADKPKSLNASLPFAVIMWLAAASGVFFFVLQVFWERMFAQVHENSIYSFAIVLAVLLLGLGLGAMLAHCALVRNFNARKVLAYSWLATAVVIYLTPQIFLRLTDGLSYLKVEVGSLSYGIRILWLTLPTVLLPSALAGMALPLIMELASHASKRPAGHVLGLVLGANTTGAIFGALLAAFVLPQWLGLWGTFVLAALFLALLAILPGGRRMLGIVVALVVAATLLGPSPRQWPKTSLQRGDSLLAIRESSHGIVAVVENSRGRRLKLNNHYILGGTASTGDERMQAHIPLLLHPSPKRVAFLGLGTGITAGAFRLHPTEKITAVEIVPEAIAFAGQYFAEANLGVINSSSAEIMATDARNFLKASKQKFDVIVGDLFVPWRRGEASLYTIEHFRAVRQALAQGGLFCQWLPMFQLSENEFKIVAATFLDVFPNTTVWRGDFSPTEPAIALIGHGDNSAINPASVARRISELQTDPANPFMVHPAALWVYFAGSLDDTSANLSKAARNTEDEPWLELLAPKRREKNFVGRPLNTFLASLPGQLEQEPSRWRDAGNEIADATLLLSEGKQTEAQDLFNKIAAELPPPVRPLVGASP